jgi:hypothetical protein
MRGSLRLQCLYICLYPDVLIQASLVLKVAVDSAVIWCFMLRVVDYFHGDDINLTLLPHESYR